MKLLIQALEAGIDDGAAWVRIDCSSYWTKVGDHYLNRLIVYDDTRDKVEVMLSVGWIRSLPRLCKCWTLTANTTNDGVGAAPYRINAASKERRR